jgi:Tfp pilus assembly protein PilN
VKIFTKRNALIGYMTVKAASRARRQLVPYRQPRRRARKLALLFVLGLVSVGVLAALGALAMRRQRAPQPEGEAAVESEAQPEELVVTDAPEPSPAA